MSITCHVVYNRLPSPTIDCGAALLCQNFFGQPRYVPCNFNNCYVISSYRTSVNHFLFDLPKNIEIDDNRCQSRAIIDDH